MLTRNGKYQVQQRPNNIRLPKLPALDTINQITYEYDANLDLSSRKPRRGGRVV